MVDTVELEKRVISLHSASNDNRLNNTADAWIAYFNRRNEIMVSMPDLYLAGKSNNTELLESLRKDFKERWIISSTRIFFEEDYPNARVIHNYGSKVIQPIEQNVIIPEYRREPLANVLDTEEGLRFLQVLFWTLDGAPKILETLQQLSNYPPMRIKVWSKRRIHRPSKEATGFDYSSGAFQVDGVYSIYTNGRSRGMEYQIAK